MGRFCLWERGSPWGVILGGFDEITGGLFWAGETGKIDVRAILASTVNGAKSGVESGAGEPGMARMDWQ